MNKTPYQLCRGVRGGTRCSSPQIVFSVWKRSSGCQNFNVHVSTQDIETGDTVRDGLEAWCSETPTVQYIIYNTKDGSVCKLVSSSEKRPCWTCPGGSSSPPPSVHGPGTDSMDSPHPEPASDHVLAPSRTLLSNLSSHRVYTTTVTRTHQVSPERVPV